MFFCTHHKTDKFVDKLQKKKRLIIIIKFKSKYYLYSLHESCILVYLSNVEY